ncbi:protein kinase domain-containing protein (plasmid) [Tundrisphaera lichenicola]|uniref:bifunctional serine/threonine-protein kinase/formylglycine-generating enzyme family protein n=1 Tax=Tundrisphaera lichenicola TaxID=2029860 RepID=UPI003EB95CCB
MSTEPPAPDVPMTLSIEARIDEVCDRYEAAWKAGGDPRIETYLERVTETERPALFRQLLALELELRSRRGERPDRGDYLTRYYGYAAMVEEAFRETTGRTGPDPTTTAKPGPGELGPPQQVFTETRSLLSPSGEDKQFGRYRLLRILGQGAFGRVHLAFDEELKRQVAIKEPNPERFRDPGDAEVYLAEARIAATLDHPNIVSVYDVGRTAEGSVYVVSKFVEGHTLADLISDRPTVDKSTRLVATVARALGHAHRKRLVHRDVKPANILIEGDTGTPYVADFGLAIREEDSLMERNIAGTPAYMSPEQVRGEGHRLDGRSDIFSLGVIFYELLTGKRPFRGSTMMEIFHQVTSDDPPPPRSLDEAIPTELERICLKALAKRASDRYAMATEMADDLEHWAEEPRTSRKQVAIIPRGLRSFGADDADFFLELLPGSRGRDGLPESIRFWKSRIEESDLDRTFDVGLIYGPSGCGKSSFVKAGLLPHLPRSIVAVYVEATADDTETRVLRGLRKHLPELSEELGLVETFMSLRRGGSTQDRKVVVILDQFEQWLHARRGDQETELVSALRQCDGGKLQAIVMVRDDFSMAASRLMRELEAPIVEGHNFATIDLFDHGHAVKVLAKFGQAFGKLPVQAGNMTPAEKGFLDRVVSGLAQDGKLVSVRLALFAEMVKDKPWVPATLDEVGGTEGIGVNFLEESFSGRKANPEHCHHQQAARQVLKALLPEVGTDIKGHMTSHIELLAVSGYADRPGEFRDVLRILDGALRLITPTDPDGSRSDSGSDPGAKFYQLTHDYLVPSLREWLTRKQKETRRGRAELRLAELAALWNAKPENRRLPSWSDYRTIRRLVASSDWTEGQRTMMHHAEAYHAQAMVRRLLEADLRDVPAIVGQIRTLRSNAVPLLQKEQQAAAESSKAKLHTALALLAVDGSQLDYLYEQLLQAAASDFPVLRDALAGHRDTLAGRLWQDATSGEYEERRLRAAAALASYAPDHPGWRSIRKDTACSLTLVKPEFLGDWKDALRPVKSVLLGPLSEILRDRELGELQRALATSALADYASEDVGLLIDLNEDADPLQFAELFPVLARHGAAATDALEAELDRVAVPDWGDGPLDPAWREIAVELRRVLESAAGIVEQRFVLCQSLPYARFGDAVEQLGGCGYHPRCVRPFRVGASLMVAAVWTRDDRAWQWLDDSDPEAVMKRDDELRTQGFVPIDVSVYLGPENATRYIAVWEKANGDEAEVRLLAGPLGVTGQENLATLVEERFNCQSCGVVLDGPEHPRGTSIWTRRKDNQKCTTRLFHDLSGEFREDDCPGLLLTDARLTWGEVEEGGQRSPALLTTALWNVNTRFESRVIHGPSIVEHRFLGTQLATDGFRPAKVSVIAGPEHGLPVAVTVWHRPLVPEEARDRLARRQANAAVALLRLKHERKVWPMLEHRPDPRARSYLIHRMSPLETDPVRVLEQLAIQEDVSVRRALILTLGEFDERQIPPWRRDQEVPRLLDLYANDPDPGIHGATTWTLRHWGRQDDLSEIDRRYASKAPEGGRKWYVNRQQQTFSVVDAPGEILLGSPPYEAGREGGPEGDVEMQRYVRIDHAFAIMTCAVTVGQFLEHRKEFYYRKTFSRTSTCPINNVTWYDGAAYCNWLNEREGVPREEWCYLPNAQGEYAEGMTIVADVLERIGYRLPTDAEWEYACRAGSITSRYYGQSADLDNYYSWTAQNALGTGTAQVGMHKPNDLGLFDMLGNVLEWVQDEFREHFQPIADPTNSSPASTEVVTNQKLRLLRPSNYAWHSGANARSSECGMFLVPNGRVPNTGFRVSRTCAPSPFAESSELRNDRHRVCRGVSFVHNTIPVRTNYRVRYPPNFSMNPWGIRTARTMPW